MKYIPFIIVLLCLTLKISAETFTNNEVCSSRALAVMLADEGDHHNAAIEFRRLAMMQPEKKAENYQAAAYEYMLATNTPLVSTMLDQAENTTSIENRETIIPFLRAENAYHAGEYDQAAFYYQCILDSTSAETYRNWSARRLAGMEVMMKNPDQAKQILEQAPGNQLHGLEAVQRYMKKKDKKPLIGGLLGMIPGLGYMYSGEYANGTRSILLNGLFIFGMVTTAQDDQWGGFAVISFFEITWYTGSIYGGIDAAHRYNDQRMEQCIEAIQDHASYHVSYGDIPLFSLQFTF